MLLGSAAIGGLWLAWRGHGRLWLLPSLAGGGAALLLSARLAGADEFIQHKYRKGWSL